ncbi:MAG: hypothetical protein ACI9IA_002021 [Enterobacterales bacterium]|jgi:hypothetical protein
MTYNQTLLNQIIKHHYAEFQKLMEAQNRPLPKYMQKVFDEHLRCGLDVWLTVLSFPFQLRLLFAYFVVVY